MSQGKRRAPGRPPSFDTATLPAAGTVYVVPSAGGFGACRVLATRTPNDKLLPSYSREYSALVAVTRCWGKLPPMLTEPCISQFLPDPKGGFRAVWLSERPPSDVRVLGVLPLRAAEQEISCNYVSDWDWVRGTVRREAASVVAGSPEGHEEGPVSLKAGRLEGQGASASFEIDMPSPFSEWMPYISAEIVDQANELVRQASTRLRAVASSSADEKAAVLREVVEGFSALNDRYQFIGTIERENVFETLVRLAEENGLSNAPAIIDEWREW